MFTHESGTPGGWSDTHEWSKLIGATGVEMLVGGVSKLATSCDDVGRLGSAIRRFAGGGCFVPGTLVTLSELPTTSQRQEALWGNDSFVEDITDPFASGTALLPARSVTKQTVKVAIEDVPLGARVPTKNPNRWDYDDSLPEPDETTWAKFTFTIERSDGGVVDAGLIRPRSWIEVNGIRVGNQLPMNIEELQIDGCALVTSVEACPPIAHGDGNAVTGRFLTRQVDKIASVTVRSSTGKIETVEGTTIHPVWSVDQQDWIGLGDLTVGETLTDKFGAAIVVDVHVKAESTPVYNIEIHGEHVYQVGKLGLLVHNSAEDCIDFFGNAPKSLANTKQFQFADRAWFNDIDAYRALKANIKQNGLKNKLIEFVEIDGQRYIVRGNGRLSVAEDLGIADQLVFQKVELPFLGYRNANDVIEEALNIIYNRPRGIQ